MIWSGVGVLASRFRSFALSLLIPSCCCCLPLHHHHHENMGVVCMHACVCVEERSDTDTATSPRPHTQPPLVRSRRLCLCSLPPSCLSLITTTPLFNVQLLLLMVVMESEKQHLKNVK